MVANTCLTELRKTPKKLLNLILILSNICNKSHLTKVPFLYSKCRELQKPKQDYKARQMQRSTDHRVSTPMNKSVS